MGERGHSERGGSLQTPWVNQKGMSNPTEIAKKHHLGRLHSFFPFELEIRKTEPRKPKVDIFMG